MGYRGRFTVACVLLLAVPAARSLAQVFRSNVLTVPVTVTVVDSSGRLVTGLTQDDFDVFEDGDSQRVTTFTSERVAVSLGVLLDVSDSMRGQKMTDAGTPSNISSPICYGRRTRRSSGSSTIARAWPRPGRGRPRR